MDGQIESVQLSQHLSMPAVYTGCELGVARLASPNVLHSSSYIHKHTYDIVDVVLMIQYTASMHVKQFAWTYM